MKPIKKIKIIKKEFVVVFLNRDNLDFFVSHEKHVIADIISSIQSHLSTQNFLNFVVFEKNNIIYANVVVEETVNHDFKIPEIYFPDYIIEFKDKNEFYVETIENNVVYYGYDLGKFINKTKDHLLDSFYLNRFKIEVDKQLKSFVLNYKRIAFCFIENMFVLEIKYNNASKNEIDNSSLVANRIFNIMKKFENIEKIETNYIFLDEWYIDFLIKNNKISKFEPLHRN